MNSKKTKDTLIQSMRKATPFSRRLSLVLFILIPCLAFLFGTLSSKRYNTAEKELIMLLQTTREGAKQKEQTYLRCINNNGEYIGSTKIPYTPQDFYLKSPLFEDKEITIVTYSFCNSRVVSKMITVGDIIISVWSNFYDKNDALLWELSPHQFTIFGGYENYSIHPRDLKDPTKDDGITYITKNGIEMFLTGPGGGHSYEHVLFSFRPPALEPSYRPNGQYYAQIWHSELFGKSYKDPDAAAGIQEMEDFADTLIPIPFYEWNK